MIAPRCTCSETFAAVRTANGIDPSAAHELGYRAIDELYPAPRPARWESGWRARVDGGVLHIGSIGMRGLRELGRSRVDGAIDAIVADVPMTTEQAAPLVDHWISLDEIARNALPEIRCHCRTYSDHVALGCKGTA